MRRIPVQLAGAVAVVALTVAACGSSSSRSSTSTDKPKETTTTTAAPAAATQNIVEIASGNPDFSTLVTAVTKANLAATLGGPGPYTVFAPTNEAFAKIPADQLNAILADQAKLTSILTYHVIPSKVMAGDLQPSQKVKTVQGSEVDIQVANGTATINGCNIVKTDVEATNGVIHVIDCVLVPSAT